MSDKPCINCGGEHLPISFECPLVVKQKQIQPIATMKNISVVEANNKVESLANSSIRDSRYVNFLSSAFTAFQSLASSAMTDILY